MRRKFSDAQVQEWNARLVAGESCKQIAESEVPKLTRGQVSSQITRYRKTAGIGNLRPSRVGKRVVPRPLPRQRQAVHPADIAAFENAIANKTCLWWDGDIREGTAVFCGKQAETNRMCGEHHARCYINKKPMDPSKYMF